MKTITMTLILTFSSLAGADKSPLAKLCKIMEDYFSAESHPEELCKKHSGKFCSSMEKPEQAVCAANGQPFCDSYETAGEALCEAAGGIFCSSNSSVASGICSILGGKFCSGEIDQEKWQNKLEQSCFQ